jgi:hypothetical protein
VRTTGQHANAASTPKTGLFTAPRGSHRAPGIGARPLVALCALVGAFAFATAAAAQAEVPKLLSYGNFGSAEFRFTNVETGEVEDSEPLGVAVDQSSGDVYVAGLLKIGSGNPSQNVYKFGASHTLLSPPSPFGEGTGLYSGVAVNPTNHDVYVVDAAGQAIDTYDPSSGALVGSPFPVESCGRGSFGFLWVQIATDSAGNVYVPCAPENAVRVYSPTGTLLKTLAPSGASALQGPTGVAVDGSGDVWVADGGHNRIEELMPSGAFAGEIESEGVRSLAVGGAGGDVLALVYNSAERCGQFTAGSYPPRCYHLVEYGGAGEQLADVGAGSIAPGRAESGAIPSVALDEATGHVYVPDGGSGGEPAVNGVVWDFGPPSAPAIGRELAVEATASTVKLGVVLTPGGPATTYRFEYGTSSEYGQTAPVPDGSAGSASVQQRTVWAQAGGLQPNTTYHYRAVATNAAGQAVGEDGTFTTAPGGGCPNEALRSGFSGILPDCRAYELVTPASKDSGEPDVKEEGREITFAENQTSPTGDRFSYFSFASFPGSESDGESYLATRGPNGWGSENVIPKQSGYYGFECPKDGANMRAYSDTLAAGVLVDGLEQKVEGGNGGCSADEPELVGGEPRGAANLFVRDNTSRSYQLINVTPPGVAPASARYVGRSSDLSHVVFEEHAALTPDAPAGVEDLYEWAGGVVRFVTILPGGAPVLGSLAANAGNDAGNHTKQHVVSADGTRVFFTAGGDLYERENAEQAPVEECTDPSKACTVQVDASQSGGVAGGGEFMDASADGSRAFFLDENRLTSDSTAQAGKPDLYEYDLQAPAGERLTDLTANPAEPADAGGVVGIDEGGASVYFIAGGVLAGKNSEEEEPVAGQPNLYLRRGGATTLIAVLSPADGCVTEAACARVSSNGAFLAFASVRGLTGYDNVDANIGSQKVSEIFLYSALAAGPDRLACASCNPSGQPPTAAPLHTGARVGTTMRPPNSGGAPHYLADNGRLFFDTQEALLPSDTNGQIPDVYEYEGGQLHLISSGTSSEESVFLDASGDGQDAFFLSTQALAPQDTEGELFNIFDARAGGGFAAPVSPQCTTADACRPAPPAQPSLYGPPSSQTFSGAGNLAPGARAPNPQAKRKALKCKPGYVKKNVKRKAKNKVERKTVCVRKQARKAKNSAHANKRTGK